jgi:hypothetical protein
MSKKLAAYFLIGKKKFHNLNRNSNYKCFFPKYKANAILFIAQQVSASEAVLDTLREKAKVRNKRFVCPGDGKWPDDEDCGK